MIELLGDDFSIKIKEDNPLYDTLKKFSGEHVIIYVSPEVIKNNVNSTVEENKVKQIPEKQFESIDNELVFKYFYEAYPILKNEDTEEQSIPLWVKLLENHLIQVLNSTTGSTRLEKIKNNIYKKNNLYLVFEN